MLVTPGTEDTMVPTVHRVVSHRWETTDVATFAVEPLEGTLPPPAPGQFMMLWAPGVGEVPISVASRDPVSGRLLFTVRSVGATTAALVRCGVGSTIGVRGPFGRPWSVPDRDTPTIVVAGGVGLAPLRMLVEELVADPDRAPVELVVGARTPHDIVYADLLADWGGDASVQVTVDRPVRGWQGHVGLVTALVERLDPAPATAVRLCGPEVMMRLVAGDLARRGVDPAGIEVTLERSMACAVAHCGRCQLGPVFVCRDGAVMTWPEAEPLMEVRRW